MLQLAADLRLLDEPAHDLGIALVRLQQHLDGQVAAQVDVAALEDRPHAAPGDLALELVPAQARAVLIGHLGRPRHDQRLAVVEQVAKLDVRGGPGPRSRVVSRLELEPASQATSRSVDEPAGLTSGRACGVLGQPPGQVHDLEVGPQLIGQRRVIGQQLVGVGRLAGLDAGQVGVQDANDLGVGRGAGGDGPPSGVSGRDS